MGPEGVTVWDSRFEDGLWKARVAYYWWDNDQGKRQRVNFEFEGENNKQVLSQVKRKIKYLEGKGASLLIRVTHPYQGFGEDILWSYSYWAKHSQVHKEPSTIAYFMERGFD